MKLEEIKELKQGDKFWTSMSGGVSSSFLTDILCLEIDPLGIIEITFEYFPDDAWYPTKDVHGNMVEVAWFKCSVNDKFVAIHSLDMRHAFKDFHKAQAYLLSRSKNLITTDSEKNLLAYYLDKMPEMFI